jgi:CTP synthase
MQMAVIEFAREVLELKDANSTEFDAGTEHPVVMFMPEVSKTHMGGTMRLGARTAQVAPDSLCSRLYDGATTITERHRHRYEVNPEYVPRLRAAGLIFSATDGERMEVVELDPRTHPFFFGTQFHPEFLSRPMRPSPPFRGFVRASAKMPPAAPIVTRKPSPMSTPSPSKSSGSGAETPSPASSPSSK